MRFLIAAALLALAAIPLRAEDGPPGAGDLIAGLRSKYLDDREAAATALVKLGAEAVPLVVPLVEDSDARVQRAAVDILCRIGTAEAVRPLLPLLSHVDPELRRSVRGAFLRQGTAAAPLLRAEHAANPAVRPEIEQILQAIVSREIETVFRKQVTRSGDSGFYAGQYAELKDLGVEALPVLKQMFLDPEFVFQDPGGMDYRFRTMAGDALAAVASPADAELIGELEAVADMSSALGKTAAFTLYKLGRKEVVDKAEAELRQGLAEADPRQQQRIWLEIAEMGARTGNQDTSIEAYRKVIDLGGGTYVAHYNLACAYSMKGMKAEALAAMKTAVASGYRNAEWIALDRDLDNIRAEPEFQELIRGLGAEPGGGAEPPPSPDGPTD